MALALLYIIGGFMLLVKGADYLVDGASSIARRLKIPSIIIGLTIVAFGTSAPELAVNITSAISGDTDIALGNVIGSNIANILLILGICALVTTIPVRSRTVIKEIPFMILASLVLVFLGADVLFDHASVGVLTRTDGLALLSFFAIFLYYLYFSAKDGIEDETERAERSLPISLLFTVMGLVGLVVGGYFAVEGATDFALQIGISETLVGLTIVAVGTSLPELVSSVVAARKGETDIAVGNIVGSNIFNILLVLGITSVIAPIPVSQDALTDSVFALVAAVMLLLALFRNRATWWREVKAITSIEGILFLGLYIAYLAYIVVRG